MKNFMNKKGFTLNEVILAAVISAIVISSIFSVWIFVYSSWKGETQYTHLRVDLMKALETIKSDLRLSSLTYIIFYPSGGEPYTAISIPVAEPDANGFLTMDATGNIEWDKTILYHLYEESDGSQTLRRTVIDPRDNSLTEEERYTQLEGAVSSGTVTGAVTETQFLRNLTEFGISSLSPVIDFYDESNTPVRAGKIVFGWVELDSGEHTIKFEITGKNDDSSGYNIGIDSLMIEPCGSPREVEYYNSGYAPAGALTVSGGTVSRQYNPIWSNNNYLEFSTSGTGNYIEIADYYDLWRESCFDNCSLSNVSIYGEEMRIKLDIPTGEDDGTISWYSYAEAGDSDQNGRDGTFPAAEVPPLTIRNIVDHSNIDEEADLIKVKFTSSSTEDLIIDKAYITLRNGTSGADGLGNQDPSSRTVEEYHRHQQLFFEDAAGNVTEGTTIPAGSEKWSVWTAFPLRQDSDYLITYYISTGTIITCKYWEGIAGTDRTYYLVSAVASDLSEMSGTPDWSSLPVGMTLNTSEDIFITTNIATARNFGSIESQVFDTTKSAPVYNELKWSQGATGGTSTVFKARSASDEAMTGVSDWSVIAGSGTNPQSLSIDSERYVQFYSEITSPIAWASPSMSLDYKPYISNQITLPSYQFPEDASGNPLVTGVYSTWVDDVQIDWPGESQLCTITGYIAKKNNYGQAKVVVDGQELMKILSLHAVVGTEFNNKTYEQENYIEIEPRNTGK